MSYSHATDYQRRMPDTGAGLQNVESEAGKSVGDVDNSVMQAMLNTGSGGLEYQSGVRRVLPEHMKGKLESHFGYSVDHLEFRESEDVDSIGAQAYTAGNMIHFRPGKFQPNTSMGQKMIGHEVAHVLQQAKGGTAAAGEVSVDSGLETSADRHGEAVASMKDGAAGPALKPMPSVAPEAAPVQGWGVGGFLSQLRNKMGKLGKKHGYANGAEGAHEMLTRKAAKKAGNALGQDLLQGNEESFRRGARFNDVYHSNNLGFGLKYAMHTDEFINQTHHGDMQFLHSMDTSGGDLDKNVEKMRRWGEFAADTYSNKEVEDPDNPDVKKKFQDLNLLSYLLKQDNDPIQEMLFSTMVSKKALKKIEKKAKQNVERQGNAAGYKDERMSLIREHLSDMQTKRNSANKKDKKEAKKGLSKYADMSIGNFFTGGDTNLSAGHVALGSAAHMLEDSFAGSHAIRGYNTKYNNILGGIQIGADQDQAVANQTTGIMINADYDAQDSGKHGTADVLRLSESEPADGYDEDDMNIKATQGAGLARDVAAQYMYDVAAGQNVGAYLQSVLAVDQNAKERQGQLTGSGRQYGKTVTAKDVRGDIKAYQKSMKETIAPNISYTPFKRNHINSAHLDHLSKILGSTDKNVNAEYKKHVNEILVESMALKAQTANKGEQDLIQETINKANRILAAHK